MANTTALQETVYKVAISVPNEAFVLPDAYENHILLAHHLGRLEKEWEYQKRNPRYEFYRFSTGRLLTPMAREKLTGAAIESGMDFMIQLDNDMLYPRNVIELLLQDMEEHPEIDILAPLAFMRNPPHYAVMYTTIEGYDQKRHKPYFINQFVKKYPREKLVECDAVGFGAACIRMKIIKNMTAPYFFSTTGTGEDIYFCMKARQESGARIFMDTRIKLGHIGKNIVIDEEYFDQFAKETNLELPEVPHKYVGETR